MVRPVPVKAAPGFHPELECVIASQTDTLLLWTRSKVIDEKLIIPIFAPESGDPAYPGVWNPKSVLPAAFYFLG